jgi:hypothetical protein
MKQLYRSPNGDTWFLARDPATGAAYVRHQANAPSGGQVTDAEIDHFLSGPQSAGNEWSDADMKELDDMLLRGLSMEEIARRLRRDHGEIQDKVVEIGRACRASPHETGLEHRKSRKARLEGRGVGNDNVGAAASIAPGRGPPAPNPSGPLGERALVGAPSAASDGGGHPWLGP